MKYELLLNCRHKERIVVVQPPRQPVLHTSSCVARKIQRKDLPLRKATQRQENPIFYRGLLIFTNQLFTNLENTKTLKSLIGI